MHEEELIDAHEFCTWHHVELSFISSLQDSGLIEKAPTQDAGFFIRKDELHQLEKMVRLYYEMDINLEGIETITHLLQQMHDMRGEITALQNRLGRYEKIVSEV